MISGLAKVTAHRMWFVEDFTVWGLPGLGEVEYLTFESTGASGSVRYGSTDIGASAQVVPFAQLVDHRGNHLPASLESPRVFPRSKERSSVFVIGKESGESFKIGRDPGAAGPVTVDLLVVEMGD
jgi:hypothetical protein